MRKKNIQLMQNHSGYFRTIFHMQKKYNQGTRLGFDIFEDNDSTITIFKEKPALHESTELDSESENDE